MKSTRSPQSHDPTRVKVALRRALHDAVGAGLVAGAVACGTNGPVDATGGTGGTGGDVAVDAGAGSGGAGAPAGGAGGGGFGGGARDASAPDVRMPRACETLAPPPCVGNEWARMALLTSNKPLDYLAFQRWLSSPQEEIGTPCASASDRGACLAKLDKARTESAQLDGKVRFIGTRGDDVFLLQTSADFLSLFAPIDNATEAAFVAHFYGVGVSCSQSVIDDPRRGIRCTENGFEATYHRAACENPSRLLLVRIPSEGASVEVVDLGSSGPGCSPGRAPDGLSCAREPLASPVLAWLQEAAMLEAASIPAFLMLVEDLRAHGAPDHLLTSAREAAFDEVRHAQLVHGLLSDRQPARATVDVRLRPRKTLFELAAENAVEACVRETFAALIAAHQAQHASDERVAIVMTDVAADEASHAELAHAIAAWAEPQLSDEQRTELRRLQRAAIADLRASWRGANGDPSLGELGLPTPDVALRLIDQLDAHLWSV